MGFTITATFSINISQDVESVWDFTQDYSKRTSWDSSILSAQVLESEPVRLVAINMKGGVKAKFKYKQEDRPNKTNLAMIVDIESPIIIGGGGSRKYEAVEGGTQWTQTNSIIIKNSILYKLLIPLIRSQLKSNTRKAMQKAKMLIESDQ